MTKFFSTMIINKTILLLSFFLFTVISCTKYQTNKQITVLKTEFIDSYFKYSPVQATLSGDHFYDNQLDDLSKKSINERTIVLNNFFNDLTKLDTTLLDSSKLIDYYILKQQIKTQFWELKYYREWEKNPIYYTNILKKAVTGIITNDDYPLEVKSKNLLYRLKKIPLLIENAKENIKTSSQIALYTAHDQINSINSLLTSEVIKLANMSTIWHDSLLYYNSIALDSLKSYDKFLNSELSLSSLEAKPIGKKLYLQVLRNRYQVNWTAEEAIANIEDDYEKYYLRFEKSVNILYKKYFRTNRWTNTKQEKKIEKVVYKISNRFYQDELIIQEVNDIVKELKIFLDVKAFLDYSENYELQIKRTEKWQKNSQLSYLIDNSVLSDKQKFTYYLHALPQNINWVSQITFLKRFNKSMLHVITMHNLLPGKLLIKNLLNQYPDILRKIFQDKSYEAGWSLLAGFLMIESGYKGYNKEIELIYNLLYLRILTKALIDIKYHALELNKKDAIQIFMDKCFIDENIALHELDNIILNPGSNIIDVWGFIKIRNLYNDSRYVEKDYFSKTKFLQRLVKHGAIPFHLLNHRFQLEIRNSSIH